MEIARSSIVNHRKQNYQKLLEIKQQCSSRSLEKTPDPVFKCKSDASVYVTLGSILNGSLDEKHNKNQFCNAQVNLDNQCDDSCFGDETDCSFMNRKYLTETHRAGTIKMYKRNSDYDLRAPHNLDRLLLAKKCHFFDIGNENAPSLFFDIGNDEVN